MVDEQRKSWEKIRRKEHILAGDNEQETTKVEFTEEQQAYVNKLVGDTRVKARGKAEQDLADKTAKEKADAEVVALAAEKKWQVLAGRYEVRAKELEGFELQAKAYGELITGMLKDRIKTLGDGAKKAIAALPDSLDDLEKLNWLNQNEALFGDVTAGVGTPGAKRQKQIKNKPDARDGHRRMRM